MPRFWKRKEKYNADSTALPHSAVQLRQSETHPFAMLDGYVPLHTPDIALYHALREAVPLIDAAILKLIRLSAGVEARCANPKIQEALNAFLQNVPTAHGQRGIQSFLDNYLDSLLTCGRAVGEIVLNPEGTDIAAVLPASVQNIDCKAVSPLELQFFRREMGLTRTAVPFPKLILFTPYLPSPEQPYGQSLLHAMPFLSNILLKIYQTIGTNWERAGNLRYSVVYKPQEGEDARASQRAELLATQWSRAMQASKQGSVRDFVSVGDVQIRVIGAEAEIPDCQIPVRLILEQLIAQTGIPPFLLGLHWSTTERMSSQQADMMTSELHALRRTLAQPLENICRLWLRLHAYDDRFSLEWAEINLQDSVEEARAELLRQQARSLDFETSQKEVEA